MMYHLDGRWRRQALVYFGEPQDLAFIFSQGWRARAFAAFVILTTRLFSVVSGDSGSRRDEVPRHARAELKSGCLLVCTIR